VRYDYWHLRRYLRLEDSGSEDTLPFGEPPVVIDNIVTVREPVWRAAVSTALEHGVPNIFDRWRWQHPLPVELAAELLPSIQRALDRAEKTRTIVYPDDLSDDAFPHPDAVLTVLRAVRDLLSLGIERDRAVETWTD
jgi:hypothetical protein